MKKTYTSIDHQVRQTMFERQHKQILLSQKVSKHFLSGLEKIDLPTISVPDPDIVGKQLEDLVGQKIVPAGNQYLSGEERFIHLSQKEFPCTDYIRGPKEIDFTPMPDLFHEYFGHMPLMAHQRMADLEQYTADLFLIHPTKQHDIYTLSRYSVEYGCIREDGEVKALGAGILSSPGDFDRFCAGEIKLLPADTETILTYKPSPHKPHDTLFVFDSVEHMRDILRI